MYIKSVSSGCRVQGRARQASSVGREDTAHRTVRVQWLRGKGPARPSNMGFVGSNLQGRLVAALCSRPSSEAQINARGAGLYWGWGVVWGKCSGHSRGTEGMKVGAEGTWWCHSSSASLSSSVGLWEPPDHTPCLSLVPGQGRNERWGQNFIFVPFPPTPRTGEQNHPEKDCGPWGWV